MMSVTGSLGDIAASLDFTVDRIEAARDTIARIDPARIHEAVIAGIPFMRNDTIPPDEIWLEVRLADGARASLRYPVPPAVDKPMT